MPDVSGEQNQIRVISSLEEMRAAVDAVAASAQRLMSIYTPDLEPDLYDQNGFLEIVKRFVLARRFAKARVLLSDSGRLLRDNNRFIAMGRRLTSCIDIRPMAGGAKQRAHAYLIADDRAIVYRVHPDRWDGVADLNNPPPHGDEAVVVAEQSSRVREQHAGLGEAPRQHEAFDDLEKAVLVVQVGFEIGRV
ncbi:MAG TPA: hypothetical protein VIV63_07760, partial [Steroidobacteraceae bacterium]